MKVEISVLGIIVIIFVIHTVLTHLLNWIYRISVDDDKSGVFLFFMRMLIVTEEVGCVVLLSSYLR